MGPQPRQVQEESPRNWRSQPDTCWAAAGPQLCLPWPTFKTLGLAEFSVDQARQGLGDTSLGVPGPLFLLGGWSGVFSEGLWVFLLSFTCFCVCITSKPSNWTLPGSSRTWDGAWPLKLPSTRPLDYLETTPLLHTFRNKVTWRILE